MAEEARNPAAALKRERAADDKSADAGKETVVIRVDHSFLHSGARFDAGTYYRVPPNEPVNFVGWHIEHNKRGAVVAEKDIPADVEVQVDPRPTAREAAEAQRIAVHPAPDGPRPNVMRQRAAAAAGQAVTAASAENLFGGTHSPEGSGPGRPAGGHTGHSAHTGSEPAAGDDAAGDAATKADSAVAGRKPRV